MDVGGAHGALPLLLNWWLLKDSEVKSRGSLSSNVNSLGGSPPGPIGLFHTYYHTDALGSTQWVTK